jgi:hypothetical protein
MKIQLLKMNMQDIHLELKVIFYVEENLKIKMKLLLVLRILKENLKIMIQH